MSWNGKTYLAYPRKVRESWVEVVITDGEVTLGAWRSSMLYRNCGAELPFVGRDGKAAMMVIRRHAETSPLVFIAPVDQLMTPPAPEQFGPPDAALIPRGVLSRSADLLVLWEHYGRFTVRELATGATWRPEPPTPYAYLEHPTAVGRSVYYWVWPGTLASIWTWTLPPGGSSGVHAQLLGGAPYSYDSLATDGVFLVWDRSKGQTALNTFEEVELWASPIAPNDPQSLAPKLLGELPGPTISLNSIGEGWAAANTNLEAVHLYPLNGGAPRRLPFVTGLEWGSAGALGVAGGSVWVVTRPTGVPIKKWITRFEIDQLPPLESADGGL